MLRALLLDLDDTLLVNDWNAFFPPYLDLLIRQMADLVPTERFIAAFDAGIEAMVRSDGTQGTLDGVFMRHFVAAAGCDEQAAIARFSTFYAEQFERLQTLTAPDPAAQELIAVAQRQGLKLAVATQPLFPRGAILARLRWAGVPDETVGYDYISAYDILTACKPWPAFFQTILAALAVAPQEALMVGDSASADMPAGRLGLKTFYVERGRDGNGQDVACDARGTLAELVEMLRSGAIHEL